jgi:hypothetical protein
LRSKESGWPIPPPAPSTATLVCRAEVVEKARVWVDKRREADRENMRDVMERWQCEYNLELERALAPSWSEFSATAILRARAEQPTTHGRQWCGDVALRIFLSSTPLTHPSVFPTTSIQKAKNIKPGRTYGGCTVSTCNLDPQALDQEFCDSRPKKER